MNSIKIPSHLLKSQNFDESLRYACDQLSAAGIRNYIHYKDSRVVELLDEQRWVYPVINFNAGTIEL